MTNPRASGSKADGLVPRRLHVVASFALLLAATAPAQSESPRESAAAPASAPAETGNPLADGLADVAAIERWFERMAEQASDLSVLFGMPATEDRRKVAEGAKEVLSLAGRATRRLEAGIAAHDRDRADESAGASRQGTPTSGDDAARAVHARTVLLPLRAARAMLLSAALETDTAKRAKLCESAAKAARGAEPVSPWADAERSLLLGVAGLLRSAETKDGLREALDHLAAAKKTITEPDAPRALELELGDDVALASVLGVALAQTGTDAARVLDRMLTQPAFNAPGTAGMEARIVAAELRLKLLAPSVTNWQRLPAPIPDEAFAGFASEYERAERDGGDPALVLRRLLDATGEAFRSDTPGNTMWRDPGRVPALLMMLRGAGRGDTRTWTLETAQQLDRLGLASPWRRIGVLTLMNTPMPADAPARLAFARAGADLLSHLPERSDQAHVLRRAREALAPLGPAADTDLAERVFTLSHERVGTHERVTAGRTEWGLKEVFEAQAASTMGGNEYERARDLLDKADHLVSQGGRACAECWWQLLDTLLRDPAAAAGRQALIADVATKTHRAAAPWTGAGQRTGDSAANRAEMERVDPELKLHHEQEQRLARLHGVDALLALGKHEDAASLLGGFTEVQAAHPGTTVLASAAGLQVPGLGTIDDALRQMSQEDRHDWTARLIDRGWVSVRAATQGFVEPDTSAHLRQPASVLAALAPEADALPDAARAQARERCAWGTLIAGDAGAAAARFRACIETSGRRVDLLRGLGESLIASGDDAGAFACFRDIAAAAAPTGETARDHFHAWARMLEVLVRQNADGSKSATIAREARRLMLLKPGESCPECARRIEAAGGTAK